MSHQMNLRGVKVKRIPNILFFFFFSACQIYGILYYEIMAEMVGNSNVIRLFIGFVRFDWIEEECFLSQLIVDNRMMEEEW